MNGALAEALTHVRRDVVAAIFDGMSEEGFLGLRGEPLVGKTTLARSAEAQLTHGGDAAVVWVDLQGAYSPAKLAARWRHAVLRAVVGPVAASHVAALPRDMWSSSTAAAVLRARSILGDAYEDALSPQPRRHERARDFESVIALTTRLARERRCVLVLDHVEAPLLTYKHPIDPADLLWQIRAGTQQEPAPGIVVLCGHDAAESIVAGASAAFYGDGRWLTVSAPTHRQWRAAGTEIGVAIDRETVDLARGHVPTTLELVRLVEDRHLAPRKAFEAAARAQLEHASRCLLHASSLHRLGAHVLVSIANGDGPYAATPDAKSGDVARAVRQLVRAGLVRRDPNDSRGWLLVDPLVQWLLAEPMNVRPEEPLPEFTADL